MVRRLNARSLVIAVSVAVAALLVVAAVPSSRASETWTLGGAAFLSGTFDRTAYVSNGTVALAPASASGRTVVIDLGAAGTADSVYARSPFVLKDTDGTYKMWYSGYDGSRNRMLYATSPDGVTWTKQGVVMDVGTPPYYFDSVGSASVIRNGSMYDMWFHGGFWSGGVFGFWGQIYHAISTDGVTWNVTGVALPPNQGWDAGMTNYPRVVRDAHGVYRMYFAGWDGSHMRIGVATSVNGTTFVPYAHNPILDLGANGSWDGSSLPAAMAVVNGSTWTLWYDGWNGVRDQIGVAHSSDGFNWTKDAANPVFTPDPSTAWDSAGVGQPYLLTDVGGPRLYFTGTDGTYVRIGMTGFQASPASARGNYTAPVFDSGDRETTWETLAVQAWIPLHTSLVAEVRVGNSSVPDTSWSPWQLPVDASGVISLHGLTSQFIQARMGFASDVAGASPVVSAVAIQFDHATGPSGSSLGSAPFVDVVLAGLATGAGAGVGVVAGVVTIRIRGRT